MEATGHTPTIETKESQSWVARWCEVLLIVAVFFAIAGDPAPRVNEPHYLGRMKHFWDPSWCAGDVFLESPDAHGLFVWVFGWVTKWLSLTATAWVGCFLAWALLAWAWQRLSWRILPVPLAAVLTAALWVTLTNTAHLAGEWVVGGVEAKPFAYVFVLLALRALVDRQWNRVWLALGIASAFHVLVGGWSFVVCGGIWLAEQVKGSAGASPSRALVSMMPGLAVGGFIALLGLVPAIQLNMHQPPEIVAEANHIYVFERLPHHLALLTLPAGDIVVRLVRHILLVLCLWAFARVNLRNNSTSYEPLRRVTWYAWGAVALAVIGFVIEIGLWNQPQLAASLLRYYWFRLTDVAVPLALALQAVAFITAEFRARKPSAVWLLALSIAIAGYHIGLSTVERVENPTPPADVNMHDPAAWADACDWIAENTPRGAVFLTPRRAVSFKWRTGRAEVANRKDIPQDAEHMVQWFHRLEDLFYYQTADGSEPFDSIGQLGIERAVEMAHRYGANYIVADQDNPLALRVIYPTREHPNDKYVVYKIED